MPTEVRRLVFSNAEFYAALDQYLSRTGTSLPSGPIVKIKTDMIHDTITIDIFRGAGATNEIVTLEAQKVGGALISYCIDNRVPLPRGFSKSLIVTGDNIALDMTNAVGALLLGVDRAHTVAAID